MQEGLLSDPVTIPIATFLKKIIDRRILSI